MERFVPWVHIAAAIFSVILLGISAYVVHVTWGHPTPNFILFSSLWSLLVLGYVAMTPRFAPRLFHGTISLALLWLTTIFWFAGAIAYSVWAGYPYCHGSIWCGSNQAGIAFSWILFVLFTFLAVVETLRFRRGSVRTGPAVV
ncbi:hypothetical protein QC761_505020 [Podospora bellae-mahoneyi]|uniref:MARVEL domain-containing protein n=2 Tax=Podospora TaxID=5144 RepID=A0ABY6SEH3_PODCO|nr:hypothetical protein QC761_505020 [Podospora bellae-mahoneyi]VBB81274.1 Putative protein of unknown function [Podospora comata]